MEFRFAAPMASAAAATPVFALQPAIAATNARPATRAVIVRIRTPSGAKRAEQTPILRGAANIRSFAAHEIPGCLASGWVVYAVSCAGSLRRPDRHHFARSVRIDDRPSRPHPGAAEDRRRAGRAALRQRGAHV